jgi:hypothetical protein
MADLCRLFGDFRSCTSVRANYDEHMDSVKPCMLKRLRAGAVTRVKCSMGC